MSLTAVFWLSITILYLELLLIRWIGTEIRIFAYLQNTVLVVCFLGLGVGMFTSRRPIRLWRAIGSLVILTGLLAFPPTRELLGLISRLLSVLGDINIWFAAVAENTALTMISVIAGLGLTLVVMVLIVEPFVPLGRLLGRWLDDHPRTILAYSLNVAGSLLGIWLFVLLGRLNGSPTLWFAVLALLLLPLAWIRAQGPDTGELRTSFVGGSSGAWGLAVAILALVPLGWLASDSTAAVRTVWSPYQKLALYEHDRPGDPADRYIVQVNNVGYQEIMDLRPEILARAPELYSPEQVGFSQYDLPFLLHPEPTRSLIVGTGGGNDVAGALRNGAERITAVEIDPAIVEFGRRYHPERPYASDSVQVIIDDARSYLAITRDTYDVIAFGLLDSHTTGAMTNTRLDHFVYTRESLSRARDLLSDGGMLFLTFDGMSLFVLDRIGVTLEEVFGRKPMVIPIPAELGLGWGGVMFVAGDLETAWTTLEGNSGLSQLVAKWNTALPVPLTYSTVPATDDWPYLYLEEPGVPVLYLLLAVLLLFVFRHLKAGAEGDLSRLNPLGWSRGNWHFFFLGAAFLLLEVHGITKASVVLGSTWVVNAVIISGVLSMVLVANVIAALKPRLPLLPVWGLLLGSVVGLYFFDLTWLSFLPYGTKALVVGGLTTLPMLFGGIVFIRSFAVIPRKDRALGANLLGALAGGLLQSLSFLVGISALVLIVAAFYGLAWATSVLPLWSAERAGAFAGRLPPDQREALKT